MKKNMKGASVMGLIIVVIAIWLVLSFFDIRIRVTSGDPKQQEQIEHAEKTSTEFWEKYIEAPLVYLWEHSPLRSLWYRLDTVFNDAVHKIQ